MVKVGKIYYRRNSGICAITEEGQCYFIASNEQNKKLGFKKGDKIKMYISDDDTIINYEQL